MSKLPFKNQRTASPQSSKPPSRRDRLLVAWLPYFRLERCGWTPHESVVLTELIRGIPRVIATSRGARDAGVQIGMSSTEARAILPQLHLECLHEADAEQRDLQSLCMQFQSLSAHPYCLLPDTICAPIGKTSHLLGGENACVEMAMRLLRRFGHWSRIWIVDGDRVGSAIAAKALAQWTDSHRVVPTQRLKEVLVDLPLDFLPIEKSILDSLFSVGIRTAGEFAQIPPASVAHRYGKKIVEIHKTCRSVRDHSTPKVNTPIKIAHHHHYFFQTPASTFKELSEAVTSLSNTISQSLIHENEGASGLRLMLKFENQTVQHIELRLIQPSQSPHSFSSILRQHFSNSQFPDGVEEVSIEAHNLTPYVHQQNNLWDHNESQEDLTVLWSRLEERFGNTGIFFSAVCDRHLPEKAWLPFETQHSQSHRNMYRPALMLKLPTAITVHTSHKTSFDAITVNSKTLSVRSAKGPERLSGDWWNQDDFDRSYWRIDVEGDQSFWIFRDNKTHRWWLHGWFE